MSELKFVAIGLPPTSESIVPQARYVQITRVFLPLSPHPTPRRTKESPRPCTQLMYALLCATALADSLS